MSPMTLGVVALLVIIAMALVYRHTTRQGTQTARGQPLRSRPLWKSLPTYLLDGLAVRLGSAVKVEEFASLCERTGILKNNILTIASGHPAPESSQEDTEEVLAFELGMIASTLVSYASHANEAEQPAEARRAAELAILLRPRHVVAWGMLAMAAYNSGDCRSAIRWADKVLSFRPDPTSTDYWERSLGSEDPRMLEVTEEQHARMREIKRACGE